MFILTVLVFFSLFWHLFRDKNIDAMSKRIILIYVLVWGFAISGSSLGPYGLYIPSVLLRIFLILHVIAFVLGYKSIKIQETISAKFNENKIHYQLNRITNSKFFQIISVVLTLYTISLVIVFFNTLAVADLADMRNDFYEGDLYGPIFSLINGPILSVFNIIAMPIFAWMLIYKRNFLSIILGLYLFGYAALGGGRLGFLFIFAIIFFVALCVFITKTNLRQRLYKLSIMGIIVLVLITIITSLRLRVDTSDNNGISNSIDATTKQICLYAIGPISALDYSIENNYVDRIGGYKYGSLTLSSVEALLYSISNKIGIDYDKSLDKLVKIKQDEYIVVGDDMWWNALYTTNLYYFLDFGYLGIIILPFLFGRLFRFFIRYLYVYSSASLFIFISHIFIIVFMSFVDFRLVTIYPLLLLIVLFFIGTRSRIYYKYKIKCA